MNSVCRQLAFPLSPDQAAVSHLGKSTTQIVLMTNTMSKLGGSIAASAYLPI